MNILIYPILIPVITALILFTRKRPEIIALVATIINLLISFYLYNKDISFNAGWVGFGMDFSLRCYQFSAFILAAVSVFTFFIALYSSAYMKDKENSLQFYLYLLITLSFVNGAVLADNLVLLLFFWEGLLAALFGLIYIGGKDSFKTAIKAFTIIGISDLTMMLGIGLTAYLAGTLTISKIHLELTPAASCAFTLMMIGAIAKAGSMPFHSWIPDAATDAPLPFMAYLPASIEKLLGIYLLTRITLDMFVLNEASWVCTMLMIIGSITIILAVMMALIQKDYKKLLSYHAISQVGYMILGIGTAVPAGIIGGLFHMLNNAMYKSCLFLTGGSIEKQTGTTDLSKLGGIALKMPVTFACFFVAALSISGVPPFNGFFSKELIYDAALERGMIFYIAALAGSFFTAASFLKLGHAAYLGRANHNNIKESSWQMLLPMVIVAAFCLIFGLYNHLPINHFFQPVIQYGSRVHSLAGWPTNAMLVIISSAVLLLALITHTVNAVVKKSGLKAADYIHYAPVLKQIFDAAEKKQLDPYDLGLKLIGLISRLAWMLDRAVDWIYGGLSAGAAYLLSFNIRKLHKGNYSEYLAWALGASIFVIIFILMRGT